jgi:hypothetical protein
LIGNSLGRIAIVGSFSFSVMLIASFGFLSLTSGPALAIGAPSPSPNAGPNASTGLTTRPVTEPRRDISSASTTNQVSVVVPATVQWVNTGVSVSTGEQLTFSATGSWTPGSPQNGLVGPDGSSIIWGDNFLNLTDIGVCAYCANDRFPHWAALIGYIGSNPPPAGGYANTTTWRTEAQKIFVVGSNLSMTSTLAGTLWLAFNDDAYSGNVFDNAGQVTATISFSGAQGGGPLAVQLFKQTDPTWSGSAYGSPAYPSQPNAGDCGSVVEKNDSAGTKVTDIYHCGCFMTDWAMIINYFGSQRGISPNLMTPAALNSWLRSNGGYDPLDVVYGAPVAYANTVLGIPLSAPKTAGARNSANDQTLNTELQKTPVILQVTKYGASHFVLATGQTTVNGQATWTINDPGYSGTTLYDYGNTYLSLQWSDLQTGPVSLNSMEYALGSPAELLVTDPSGNRTGSDPRTGATYDEIPDTTYLSDAIGFSDSGTTMTPHVVKTFSASAPVAGVYSVQVIGTGSGSYSLTSITYDTAGNPTTVSLNGQAEPNSVDSYAVTYSPINGAPTTISLPPSLGLPPVQQVDYDDLLTLNLNATDPDDPASSLRFGASGLPSGLSLVDHLDGTAAITGSVQTGPGTYSALISAVDPGGLGTTQPISIVVSPEESAISTISSSILANGNVVVSTVLTEDGQTPVGGRTVTFNAGSAAGSGTTDANGNASATLALAPGQYTMTATFAGDSYYLPSTSSAQTLYVYQPTSFVIWGGNLPIPPGQTANVAIGQDYTFWGSQWAKQVQSGAYQSNASFKGYANSVSGATWTSDPGNSSGPPATVASYISVIVTTQATKNGNVESGNVAETVVLQVDNPSGYRPNPGHPASGSLVAIVQ